MVRSLSYNYSIYNMGSDITLSKPSMLSNYPYLLSIPLRLLLKSFWYTKYASESLSGATAMPSRVDADLALGLIC